MNWPNHVHQQLLVGCILVRTGASRDESSKPAGPPLSARGIHVHDQRRAEIYGSADAEWVPLQVREPAKGRHCEVDAAPTPALFVSSVM